MNNNFITEISEEDFRKLDLIGLKNTRVELGDGTHTFRFLEVKLNTILDDAVADGAKEVVIAIHEMPDNLDCEVEEELEKYFGAFKMFPEEMQKEAALHSVIGKHAYYDKWLNHSGASTYIYNYDVGHIYSTRDYFEAHEGDYFRAKKKETKAVYVIHLGC